MYMYMYMYIYIYIYITTKLLNIGTKTASIIKPFFWTRTDIAAWLSKSPGKFHRLRGSRAQKEQFKNKTCLDTQPMKDDFELFDSREVIFGAPM